MYRYRNRTSNFDSFLFVLFRYLVNRLGIGDVIKPRWENKNVENTQKLRYFFSHFSGNVFVLSEL